MRKTTPADRRVYLVVLTERGFDLYEKHSGQHKKMAEAVVGSISGDQVTMLVEMLRTIVNKSS